MQHHPPQSFVDLRQYPFLSFDIAYARHDNFTGKPLPGYGYPGAWLHKDAAESILELQQTLKKLELGLLIWDAYRPYRATRHMVSWARRPISLILLKKAISHGVLVIIVG